MDKQRLVFGVALLLMLAGYVCRIVSSDTQMVGHALVGLGAIGGVIGFSMKPANK